MMPWHFGTATLGILAFAAAEVVVLLDVCPEVVALHVGGIGLTVHGAIVGKVPTVELFTAGWHEDEVAGCQGIAVDIAVEDIGVTAVGVTAEVAVLIAVIDEAEGGGGVLAALELIGGCQQQAAGGYIHGVACLVVVDTMDAMAVVAIG